MAKKTKVAYIKKIYITAEVVKDGAEQTFTLLGALSLLDIPEDLINTDIKEFAFESLGEGLHNILVEVSVSFGDNYQPLEDEGIQLTLSEVESYRKE